MTCAVQETKLIPKKRSFDEMTESDSSALVMRQLQALESEEKMRHLAILSALKDMQFFLNYDIHHKEIICNKRVKLNVDVASDSPQENDSSSVTINSEAGQEIRSNSQTAFSIALNLAQRLLGETSNRQIFKILQLFVNPELLKKAQAQMTLKEIMSAGLGLRKMFGSTLSTEI